jgi:hypothetical protein
MASARHVATTTRMSATLDILKLLLGWSFATLWEMYTLDRQYHEPSTEQEQDKAEIILIACLGGICAIAALTILAGWKILLLLSMTAYPLPPSFAVPILIASIVMYVAGFITVLNADNEEEEESRGPVRLYDMSRVWDATLVVVILGAHAAAAALYVVLGMVFWWAVFMSEKSRLDASYGNYIDYRPDVVQAICGGVSFCFAAGLAAAALSGFPQYWFGFAIASAIFMLLSYFYRDKVKQNPKLYGWD